MLIFHIAIDAEWQAAKASGAYTTSTLGVTLEQEGFLHCSRDSQVGLVLSKYYNDVTEPLTLLIVDTDLLTSRRQLDEDHFTHGAGEWELPTLPAST